jgi:ABC-type multidrug transport system ATPase subunit
MQDFFVLLGPLKFHYRLQLQHLTVLESMRVAANLKLGERMPRAEKELVIKEILDTLGLIE